MLKLNHVLPTLPPDAVIETVPGLKAIARASRALADLKGQARTIPNQGILIDTLALQEARASSEIENIVTTQDELFQADIFPDGPISPAAKEVALYRDALHLGQRVRREPAPTALPEQVTGIARDEVGVQNGLNPALHPPD